MKVQDSLSIEDIDLEVNSVLSESGKKSSKMILKGPINPKSVSTIKTMIENRINPKAERKESSESSPHTPKDNLTRVRRVHFLSSGQNIEIGPDKEKENTKRSSIGRASFLSTFKFDKEMQEFKDKYTPEKMKSQIEG